MLKKATEENIVVGLTKVYDHFFLPIEIGNSKVTASHLPYFDGDCWCANAMVVAKTLEKESTTFTPYSVLHPFLYLSK